MVKWLSSKRASLTHSNKLWPEGFGQDFGGVKEEKEADAKEGCGGKWAGKPEGRSCL